MEKDYLNADDLQKYSVFYLNEKENGAAVTKKNIFQVIQQYTNVQICAKCYKLYAMIQNLWRAAPRRAQ